MEDITKTVFVINRCEYLPEDFFKEMLPGSTVEDGCVLIHNGNEYTIWPMGVSGIDVDIDLEFYTLEKN